MDLVINLHLVQEGDFLQFLREAFDKRYKKDIDVHRSVRLYHLCVYIL